MSEEATEKDTGQDRDTWDTDYGLRFLRGWHLSGRADAEEKPAPCLPVPELRTAQDVAAFLQETVPTDPRDIVEPGNASTLTTEYLTTGLEKDGGFTWSMSVPPANLAKLKEWSAFADALNARNRRLGYPCPFEPTALPAPTPTRPRAPRTKGFDAVMHYASNTVHAAAVRAFATAHQWQINPIDGFAYGVQEHYKDLAVTVGLVANPLAGPLWEFLCKGGPRMVKAHYALWGRWHEEHGKPGGWIMVNVNQFCADLGYSRHHKGGYKRDIKQDAVRLLEALTAVEMRADFTPPGKQKTVRLRGPLWSRGLIAEKHDQYTDLFGQAREGDPTLWEPLAFSYRPGPWFDNEDWRRYNRAVGEIGAGLMHLDNRYDEWAILIGGYLGTIMRVGAYAPLRLKAATILRATGLSQAKDGKRRSGEVRERFERALDRLHAVGVITSWTWPNVDTAELEDEDDPAAVAAYYATDPLPPGDWRGQVVLITLPQEESHRRRIEGARTKAIEADTRRTRKAKRKETSPAPE